MLQRQEDADCLAIDATLSVLGGKWKTPILIQLSYGPKRTSVLRKGMPGITQKVLTQKLRDLEIDGIIVRTVYNEVPPKVVYELSALGETLREIMLSMCDWGDQYIQLKTRKPMPDESSNK